MRNLFSTTLFVALFAVLGFAAYQTFPRSEVSASDVAVQAGSEIAVSAQAAAAPNATTRYNEVAFPIDAMSTFSTAQDIVDYLEPDPDPNPSVFAVDQVLEWDASAQDFTNFYLPNLGAGSDFSLGLGKSYFILVDDTVSNVFSLVGDVPDQGAIQHTLFGAAGTCKYNHMMVPLDQSSITLASELVTAMGGGSVIDQVLGWDASAQDFTNFYLPNLGAGTDFQIQAGHPYWVCLLGNTTWPQ